MDDSAIDAMTNEAKQYRDTEKKKASKKRGRPARQAHSQRPDHNPIVNIHGPLKYMENYKEPGFRYYISSVEPQKIQPLLRMGYEPVKREQIKNKYPEFDYDSKYSQYVMVGLGNGKEGILLRIPDELYKDIDVAKKKKREETNQVLYPDPSSGIMNYQHETEVVR